MQKYRHYTVQDFLKDEEFCRWVLKENDSDNMLWENWITENPDCKSRIEKARNLVLSIKDSQEMLSDDEFEAEVAKIAEARNSYDLTKKGHFSRFQNYYKYAAIISFFTFAWLAYSFLETKSNDPVSNFPQILKGDIAEEDYITISNDGQKVKTIELEDGSRITLSAESWVSYPKKFTAHARKVYLIGEAFFEVTKNPKRPFIVTTKDLITTVLGTSFTIKSFKKDPNSRVQVKTGKVTVSSTDHAAEDPEVPTNVVVLLPNQQVTFNKMENKLIKTLVENPVPIEQAELPEKTMTFENESVVNVFEILKKQYGVQIIYDEEILSQCQLNAELLYSEPLLEKIELICTAIQGSYVVIDGQIIIKGSNCGSKSLKNNHL